MHLIMQQCILVSMNFRVHQGLIFIFLSKTISYAEQVKWTGARTMTSILDPSILSQTPDITSWLSNQFVLYVVNLRQIYPKPLFYPQIPNDRSEYKIEVIV